MSVRSPQDELRDVVWLPEGWRDVHVAVALSGGVDSMALLRVLHQLKSEYPCAGQLLALHVNHRLRGQESEEDARWCEEKCDALGIPLEILSGDTAAFAADTGQGVETAARELRYQLLSQAAENAGVRYLATAHHRNDQVETILFRTLRGTGLRGLSGIPRTRSLTGSLTLIRPLLDCPRSLLAEYLSQLEQDYRSDSSNQDQQFTRNRIRHALLPSLRKDYNVEFDTALLRLAQQANDAQIVIERLAAELVEKADISCNNSSLSILRSSFLGQERIIVCEALRSVWRQTGLAEQAMNFDWWCQLAELLQWGDDATVLNLPGNARASIAGERLVLQW